MNILLGAIRAIEKLVCFLGVVTVYSLSSLVLYFFVENKHRRRKILSQIAHWACRGLITIFRIRIVTKNRESTFFPSKDASPLIISNHISYLDILVLYSLHPGVFVTSVDLRNSPGFGWLSRIAGCIFVDRIEPNRIFGEVNEISDCLREKIPVFLFPEATSSAGDRVLPFKRALLHSAFLASASIVPVALKYESVNGKPISNSNRDCVAYYGEMKFLPHFLKFLTLKEVTVSFRSLEEVKMGSEFNSKETAKMLQQKILASLNFSVA